MEKTKNCWVIPTDKPSRLYDDGLELYLLIKASNSNNDLISYKNIYITIDEEIKEGDYMLLKYEHSHGRIRKCHYIYEEQLMIDAKEDIGFGFCKRNEVYKIILTTDQDLIKDGIQAIDDEFLEWFVKNPSCEVVEVIKTAPIRPFGSLYKTIIPKEKQCTCKEHDPYCCKVHGICPKCNPKEEPKPFKDMAKLTEVDWSKFKKSPFHSKEEPKQETLEEFKICNINNLQKAFLKGYTAKNNKEDYPFALQKFLNSKLDEK